MVSNKVDRKIDVPLYLQANREPWAEYVDPLPPVKRVRLVADVGSLADGLKTLTDNTLSAYQLGVWSRSNGCFS